MQLALSEDEKAFRDEMRTFFTTEVPQELRDKVAGGEHASKEEIVQTQQILNKAGLAVPAWPEEWGGRGWTPLQKHIWHEEMQLASVIPPLAFNANMIGPVIANFGTQEMKEKFLPKTANLDIWWCQGFSEPNAGSDLASLTTKAVQDGDDWIINGQKTWTTLGQYADWIFVLARTDPEVKKQAGISMILCPMDAEGVTVRPIQLIDGSSEVNEVFFEDVRVPAENMVGDVNTGWTQAKFLLGNERVGVAPIGAIKRNLATAKELAAKSGVLDDPLIGRAVRRDRERAARPGADRAARGRQLRRRQAAPGLLGAQAQGDRAAAGGLGADGRHLRPRRPRLRRGRRLRRSRVGAQLHPDVPEPAQGLHLRRLQRGAAPDHRRQHPGTVRN